MHFRYLFRGNIKKLVFLLSLLSFNSFATETNSNSIVDKNLSYAKKLSVSMECSKGLNSVSINVFSGNGNLYFHRDSNSTMGTYLAPFTPSGDDSDVLETGITFRDYKVNRINDFYISAETLKKKKGEVIAIIYNEFYSCDVELHD